MVAAERVPAVVEKVVAAAAAGAAVERLEAGARGDIQAVRSLPPSQ